jgi:hypothetical protein
LSFENVFAGAPSFLRRRYGKDLTGVDIAVTGIPFDQAVTNRPGTRLGPRAIREASALQTVDPAFGWDGMSPLEEFAILDYGDMAFDYAHTADVPAGSRPMRQNHPRRGRGLFRDGRRSFHHAAASARPCRETRAPGADPGGRPYRHMAR